MTYEELKNKSYEAYKLHWMLSHGYNLHDLLSALAETDENLQDNYPTGDRTSIFDKLFDEFQNNIGFGQQIWACKKEFMENEFENATYMHALFDLMAENKNSLWIAYKNYNFDVLNKVIKDIP